MAHRAKGLKKRNISLFTLCALPYALCHLELITIKNSATSHKLEVAMEKQRCESNVASKPEEDEKRF
jgi:hypothetical protein